MPPFGEKLARLRKKRGLSNEQLGQELGVDGYQISQYETDPTLPSAEIIVQLARLLDASLDYLLRDELRDDKPNPDALHDRELQRKFLAVERLGLEEHRAVMYLLDAFVKKAQIERVLQE